jgi:cell division protein FtsZ
MIVRPGEINLDFADVYNVLKDQGRAVFGSGYAEGPDRAMKSVEMALHCPLLEDTSIKDVRNVLVHITGNRITLREVETACSYIYEFLHPEHSHMYFGYATRNDSAGMRVTIIVSGFPNEPPTEKEEAKSTGATAEPIVATTRRTTAYYDGHTPTPTRLERVFDEATPESPLEIDPETLRRPAIERKQPRYVFPGFRSRKREEE